MTNSYRISSVILYFFSFKSALILKAVVINRNCKQATLALQTDSILFRASASASGGGLIYCMSTFFHSYEPSVLSTKADSSLPPHNPGGSHTSSDTSSQHPVRLGSERTGLSGVRRDKGRTEGLLSTAQVTCWLSTSVLVYDAFG